MLFLLYALYIAAKSEGASMTPNDDDPIWAELETWPRQIESLDPDNFDAYFNLVRALESQDIVFPQLKNREYALDVATAWFTEVLRRRQKLLYPQEKYRELISNCLRVHPRPMHVIARLAFLVIVEDPTEALEGASQLSGA